jgi:uncharacterized membrane protein
MKAVVVFLFSFLAAIPAGATVVQYEVRGVKSGDNLNVRAAASAKARVIGRIPSHGREIEIIDLGKGVWVKIAYGRVKGYVNRRFLARSQPRIAAAKTAAPAPTPDIAPAKPHIKLDAPTAPPASAPPGSTREDGDDTPSLMKPPSDLMPDTAYPTPARLACSGTEPFWSISIAGNDGAFETADGEKLALALSTLTLQADSSSAWTAKGRATDSRLNVDVAQTGACSNGMSDQRFPYEIKLRLDDGRDFTGCCQIPGT